MQRRNQQETLRRGRSLRGENEGEHHPPWQTLLRGGKANEDQETITRCGDMGANADVTGSRFGGTGE